MTQSVLRLCAAGALLIMSAVSASAQERKSANGATCIRCTAQCNVCGLGPKCQSTCTTNGNGWVRTGPGHCTSWFAGCNSGK